MDTASVFVVLYKLPLCRQVWRSSAESVPQSTVCGPQGAIGHCCIFHFHRSVQVSTEVAGSMPLSSRGALMNRAPPGCGRGKDAE